MIDKLFYLAAIIVYVSIFFVWKWFIGSKIENKVVMYLVATFLAIISGTLINYLIVLFILIMSGGIC